MLRAAVVERDKEKRAFIVAAVEALHMDIQVSDFSNKYDFEEHLDEDATSYDILLLNTTIMKEGDGIEVAADIRSRNSKIMIAFVTESTRYYPEAFAVFATGYLLYPFEVGNLHNCITFFYEKTQKERRSSVMIKERGGNYRRIFTRYIKYIESSNREVYIHLEDGSEVATYAKLNELEESLPHNGQFLRCHQSYLVNMYFVEEYGKGCFNVDNLEIPISRKYQQIAKEAYYEYMFEKM
ncbi:MAG: response regulator transcription factor [Lachnospiraceae bacterium]|nr:response regulator transcription factor [Lachnospiraceae bacterium]